MESTVKERLVEFIRYKHLSQNKFEKIIGVGNGYVSNISKGIGTERMERIKSSFPDLNPNWLLYGEGAMINEPKVQPLVDTHIHGNNNQSGNVNIGGTDTSFMQEMIDQLKERVAELKESMSDWKSRCLSAEEQNKRLQDIIDELNKDKK